MHIWYILLLYFCIWKIFEITNNFFQNIIETLGCYQKTYISSRNFFKDWFCLSFQVNCNLFCLRRSNKKYLIDCNNLKLQGICKCEKYFFCFFGWFVKFLSNLSVFFNFFLGLCAICRIHYKCGITNQPF